LNDTYEGFTEAQNQHVYVMKRIAQSVNDTPMVLKGGTALMLTYGLDRYSEDLDFDAPKAISLESRIQAALKTTKITVDNINIKKNTDTVKRWIIQYSGPKGDGRLKIEVSFRSEHIDSNTHSVIDGIKVYNISELISQKLHAAEQRSKVRDLYDLVYLSREKQEDFSPANCLALETLSKDIDGLHSRYEADHAEDSILSGEPLDDLVLTLEQSAEELMALHKDAIEAFQKH